MLHGIIYRITNLANGKVYVGQTVRSLESRWTQHCKSNSNSSYLASAIRKHGKGNFRCETLLCTSSQADLDAMEVFFIAQYRSADKRFGYNLTHGGGGVVCNEVTREKFRQANTGPRNPQFGKKMSEEKKAMLLAARLAKPVPKGTPRRKHVKVFSPEGKARLAESSRRSKLGVRRTEDLKAKLRAANVGAKNPSFGKKWIHNPYTSEFTSVHPEELAVRLADGWLLGKSSTTAITYQGETKSLHDWSRETGIHRDTLRNRLDSGWTVEKAFNTPSRNRPKSLHN